MLYAVSSTVSSFPSLPKDNPSSTALLRPRALDSIESRCNEIASPSSIFIKRFFNKTHLLFNHFISFLRKSLHLFLKFFYKPSLKINASSQLKEPVSFLQELKLRPKEEVLLF